MKIAIIADDLTGANDSGVQFARGGLKTSVLIQMDQIDISEYDVVIIDTDSRSVSSEEAYQKVKFAAEYVKLNPFHMIYKKIDSTMRGNIGAELDAVYDVIGPDFIVFTPAYPEYNRLVKEGNLYLGNKLLHTTEFANDPKTPIKESYIPRMIEAQSKQKVGLISQHDLSLGRSHVYTMLQQFQENNKPYIVFDAASGKDLEQIVELFKNSPYHIVWSGSAGLANYLTTKGQPRKVTITKSDQPILSIVGSVNHTTRKQLEMLLSQPNVKGVKLLSHKIVSDEMIQKEELSRAYQEAAEAIIGKQHIVLYSSGDPVEVELAQTIGSQYGLNPTMVSDTISKALGQLASELFHHYGINRLILTGGDTAKQFCSYSNITTFELIGEVETGVPIGILSGDREIYGITKAGGFGSDQVLLRSLKILQGEEILCDQS